MQIKIEKKIKQSNKNECNKEKKYCTEYIVL